MSVFSTQWLTYMLQWLLAYWFGQTWAKALQYVYSNIDGKTSRGGRGQFPLKKFLIYSLTHPLKPMSKQNAKDIAFFFPPQI